MERMGRPLDAMAVGVSAGGFQALSRILPALPEDCPVPVLLVQHMPADAGALIQEQLDQICALRVKEAEDKEPIRAATVYLAPGDYHMLVEQDRHLALSVDARVNYARPSIDVLFESAAEVYGDGLVGVILTGANQDGARGLARIKALGGLTVVQDPRTAHVDVMPRAAMAATRVDHVLGLAEIGTFLRRLIEKDKLKKLLDQEGK